MHRFHMEAMHHSHYCELYLAYNKDKCNSMQCTHYDTSKGINQAVEQLKY